MRLAILFLVGALLTGCAHAQLSSVTLDWTAVGDDGDTGTAASLVFFYSPTTPDTTGLTAWLTSGGLAQTTPAGIQTWINNAINVNGPTPLPGGSPSSFTINGTFAAGLKYWFMLRTCDEAVPGNCARSNFATKLIPATDTWPPGWVKNLKTR